MKKKPLKTTFGSPVVPLDDGAIRSGKAGAIKWWWFDAPETSSGKTMIALDDIRGGLESVHDYLDIETQQRKPCPF